MDIVKMKLELERKKLRQEQALKLTLEHIQLLDEQLKKTPK